MKKRFAQTYEMTVILEVDVPDGWTEDEVRDSLEDYPVRVTIEDNHAGHIPEVGLILDSVVSLTLSDLD